MVYQKETNENIYYVKKDANGNVLYNPEKDIKIVSVEPEDSIKVKISTKSFDDSMPIGCYDGCCKVIKDNYKYQTTLYAKINPR